MPLPFSRPRRSRNRNRPSRTTPPNAPAGTFTSVTHGTALATVVFAQNMDTTITAVPPSWTLSEATITSITWTNATTAVLHTNANTTAAGTYAFPATSALRTASGGGLVAASGTLA